MARIHGDSSLTQGGAQVASDVLSKLRRSIAIEDEAHMDCLARALDRSRLNHLSLRE
jgi:energy-converting hydrogenase A subunit M